MENSATTQPMDAKTTAANIVKGIGDKASGKVIGKPADSGSGATGTPGKPGVETPNDPNAGKEKYVVEGREIWLTPDQARAYVQKGIAFEPRVSELARLQNETKQFLDVLKTDPAKILFNPRIGLTPEDVFEKIMASDKIGDAAKEKVGHWYYENVVRPLKLTPEQREAEETKKKLSEFERKEATTKEDAIRRDNQIRFERALSLLKQQVSEAMKESGLPSNDTPLGAQMARRVADIMRLARFQNKAITPKEAIEKVKAELKHIQRAYYDTLDEDKLVEELGPENAAKVKKHYLKLVKQAEKEPTLSKPRNTPAGERKVITPDDFHDYLNERKKAG